MTKSADAGHRTSDAGRKAVWLFSRNIDLSVFLGSAVLSFVALWIGARLGVLNSDTPDWAWIPAVLLIDVAHVYSTGFRVYFDKQELKRRPWLYALVPVIGLTLGVALYSEGELVFWRALAYLAVFHFVRQQYGWVALYRAKAGERDALGKWIDSAAIYAATVYPLIYWHAHLPRKFWWFVANDFSALPVIVAKVAAPIYWLAMCAYAAKALYRWRIKKQINPGKDIVVATTALCWYLGIVAYNSDYAFTVTNVIIHGVPYLALIYWYGRTRWQQEAQKKSTVGKRQAASEASALRAPQSAIQASALRAPQSAIQASALRAPHSAISIWGWRLFAGNPLWFLFLLWALAYVEELVWDRGVWHDRAWFFGNGWEIASLKIILVPLLALPQLTHYVLDGFVWRRRNNPDFPLG
ncbi:MAG: hypothetical protein HY231_21605 [Acidobacteria bacterium]|nr:hypothetical protein [Acidobacteriota bacterium]